MLFLCLFSPYNDLCITYRAIRGAKDEATGLILNESAVGVRKADYKHSHISKKQTNKNRQTVISPSVLFFKYPHGC